MITIEDSLAGTVRRLNDIVIKTYEPPSTRLHRNYNDRAWWYWKWYMEPKTDFDKEYLCTFTTPPGNRDGFYEKMWTELQKNPKCPYHLLMVFKDWEELTAHIKKEHAN